MAAHQASRDGYLLKGIEYMSNLHELSHNADFDFHEYSKSCTDINMQILRWEVETANLFLYAGLPGPSSQVQTQAAERLRLIQDKKAAKANVSSESKGATSKVAPLSAILAEMPKPTMLRPWTPSVQIKDRSVSEDFTDSTSDGASDVDARILSDPIGSPKGRVTSYRSKQRTGSNVSVRDVAPSSRIGSQRPGLVEPWQRPIV